MVKVGLVNIDVSHPHSWAFEMEKYCMDIKYHYLCNKGFRKADEEDWFVKKFNLEGKTDSIEEMVDKVDIGFVQSCNWDKHIEEAMPFIEKGKPVFIDKPLVGSVKDVKKIRELVKSGAKIIGSSSVRYADEIREFLAKPIEERGEIISVFGTSCMDEFNYSIHIVEAFSGLVNSKIINNKFVSKTEINGIPLEIYTCQFENGVLGTYTIASNTWQPFHIVVTTTKGTFNININTRNIYVSLIREIYKEYMGKKSEIAEVEMILNCTEAMLCGQISRDKENGKVISIEDLPEDAKFDGNKFEEDYSKNASVLYKD